MIKLKQKGSRNERRSVKLLETAGYTCLKSGGSLGIFDIIGISATDIVLVQVKSNCNPSPVEIEAMEFFICPKNCRKLIHRWNDYNRLPIVKEISHES